jgi:glyceraldehyde 3-phosphate dehydrogenase
MKKIALNGFGRIGRLAFRQLILQEDVTVAAINDLADAYTLAHLLKYDSAHGIFNADIHAEDHILIVNGQRIPVFAQRDAALLPWKSLGIDTVLECTGHFTTLEGLTMHYQAGARKVILSAPAKSKDVPTFVLGVNDANLNADIHILSNASCTTNCLAPMIKLLDQAYGVDKGFISTTHAYTADQRLQDAPHSDLRRARAAAVNIIPTTTGAAKAVSLVYPAVAGKLDAVAFRVPVITGSLVDLTVIINNKPTKEEVNKLFLEASMDAMQGILQFTEDPIVSSDIIGNTHSSIVDGGLTQIQGNLLKVIAWYDNEAGYATRLAEMAIRVSDM